MVAMLQLLQGLVLFSNLPFCTSFLCSFLSTYLVIIPFYRQVLIKYFCCSFSFASIL